ncbi:MAG: group I intron-associated PD-(D/E)XK endonuclease [Pyrinomonadaceae bacterium]
MQTREKGNLTEAKILAALVAAGYLVSIPFGEGHKYDFVIDDSVSIRRVQCKTGRVKNGVLLFNSYSQSGNGATKQGYHGLADLFAVLNPENGEVYLVPVERFGTAGVTLRLIPTLSGQIQKVNWAVDYLLTSLNRAG